MTTNGKGRGNAEAADAQKQKAVALAVSAIEKQFGKGAILMMSDEAIDREVTSFSSGSPSLDLALGIGGYPRGRVVEIFGPESSGKTTLALHAVAEVQRLAELHASGALTDEEFAAAKAKALGI